MNVIRLGIADDHTIVREGLKQLLEAEADLTIAGEARNAEEVIELVRNTALDVLILDMSMPGRSGIELIRQVRLDCPKVRILILSMHEEEQYAVRAIKAGASGYLTKESASSQLVQAIRKVATGGAFITPAVAEQLALGIMSQHEGPPHSSLSDREFQVFRMIASGLSVSDIALELHLSVKTISTHKARIMLKMNLGNNTELLKYAIAHNLTEAPNA
jgi:DNA-binding NarL/FixJ family response regulator